MEGGRLERGKTPEQPGVEQRPTAAGQVGMWGRPTERNAEQEHG